MTRRQRGRRAGTPQKRNATEATLAGFPLSVELRAIPSSDSRVPSLSSFLTVERGGCRRTVGGEGRRKGRDGADSAGAPADTKGPFQALGSLENLGQSARQSGQWPTSASASVSLQHVWIPWWDLTPPPCPCAFAALSHFQSLTTASLLKPSLLSVGPDAVGGGN